MKAAKRFVGEKVQIFLTIAWGFATSVFVLTLSEKFQKKYRFKYLNFYHYFLIAYYIGGIFLIFGIRFASDIFSLNTDTFNLVYDFLMIVGIPMLAVMQYLFIRFIQAVLHEKASPLFIRTFWSIWGIYSTVYLLGVWGINSEAWEEFFACHLPSACGWVYKGGIYIGILYLIVQAKKMPSSRVRRDWMFFGSLLLILFGFYHVNVFFIGNLQLITLLYFGLQVPVVMLMKIFLKRHFGEPIANICEFDRFNYLVSRFDISKREEEIFRKLLEGKSNKDIEKELFISSHTVKNHVYHIYKKMGINSRFHLIKMIRSSF
jgi:DNA-binding CsgD family transcriptional regulator